MRKVVVGNEFLANAAESLRRGQRVRLLIDGQSMYPFIHGGRDYVEVEPCPPTGDLPAWCCPFYLWEGRYMIHRYIGKDSEGRCCMLGDGNLVRVETVEREEIIGLLRTIHRPDGSVQDCRDPQWLRRGMWWYRLRYMRRVLLPVCKAWAKLAGQKN